MNDDGEAPPGTVTGAPSKTGARWLAVHVRPGGAHGAAMEALFAAGSMGVHEAGDGLHTHFPEGTDADRVRELVLAADPQAEFAAEWAPAVDWSEAWKDGVH